METQLHTLQRNEVALEAINTGEHPLIEPIHQLQLARHMVRVQEEERLRVARDLHAQIGDQVSTIKFSVEMLRKTIGSDPQTLESLGKINDAINRLDREFDALSLDLRPPSLYGGLHAAFTEYVLSWFERSEYEIRFMSSGLKLNKLPSEIEIAIFRVFQEAMNNVFKHSRARNVSVNIDLSDNDVIMTIEDDGVGFDRDRMLLTEYGTDKFGFLGMHARIFILGGKISIESMIGKGTVIRVQIPVVKPD